MSSIPITVIIPVKNEELNLAVCLKNLTDFNQVIVIDSSSTDSTPEIATKFDVEFINFKWNGKFPKKRNWALKNLTIRNEWVLFLDADEFLTDSFKRELLDKIKIDNINGYWITYRNFFMGKQLRFGDPMKKLPLFRLGKGEYEKIEEDYWSSLDMEVHEHPVIKGKTGHMREPVIHNDFKGLEHYIARHNAYSGWESKRFFQIQTSGFSGLNFRQKLKYKFLAMGMLPFIYFIGAYLFKLGFLDGRQGYYFALYKAYYFFQVQTKILELQRG